jgi:hypothetical protein
MPVMAADRTGESSRWPRRRMDASPGLITTDLPLPQERVDAELPPLGTPGPRAAPVLLHRPLKGRGFACLPAQLPLFGTH